MSDNPNYHMKRKKGTRSNFYRKKNVERKQRQQALIDPDNDLHDTSSNSQVRLNVLLPPQWHDVSNSTSRGVAAQYGKMEMGPDDVIQATRSVLLHEDKRWSVYVLGKKVSESCLILKDQPPQIASAHELSLIIKLVDDASLCPGNPEEQYAILCRQRIRRGENISIDNSTIINQGILYESTARKDDCELLIHRTAVTGLYPAPQRCTSCNSFRGTLRVAMSRQKQSIDHEIDHTSTTSHTTFASLNPKDKDTRLRNLQQSLKMTKRMVKRLEVNVISLMEKEAIPLLETDNADISTITSELNSLVAEKFAPESPQRVFWDQQRQYNSLKDKRQMRWHPLVIRFALNLKYMSSSAYNAVARGGVINLPSERTLSDYTHWTSPHTGVQLEFIEEFKRLVEEEVKCGQYHCALSMDEMKIKSGLVFNKHTGGLCGFIDLGSANRDIEYAVSDHEQDAKLAEQAFVFLVRAVFKPSLSMSIAHYFTTNLKGEQIFPLVWDVVESLEMYDIPVVSLTSDGAKPNRRFYRMCQDSEKRVSVPHKTTNPYRVDSELFFFCDAPHLLKTARNCFSNSFSHSKSRAMQKCGQTISWKWIESLYLMETTTSTPGVRLCHKLSRNHVWLNSFTRMRVHLAAQVMSESVACALQMINSDGTQQTRLFIRMIDKFFDLLNVKGPLIGKLKRKENSLPFKKATDERFKWLTDDFLGYLAEWEKEIAETPGLKAKEKQRLGLSRETVQGMRITVSSFVELGRQLLQLPNVNYLLSEVFSQDPLERYFSRQRHRGGSNENPTAFQVPYNASTLVQQRSIYRDLKSMNVDSETDKLECVSQPLRKRSRNHSSCTLVEL